MASYAASRSSSTALQVGAASSRSSPVSRSETKAPIHASSSPNLNIRNPRVLYEDVYCRRGQAENHIKSWKTHLAADRTSKATANQLRLFLHGGAYWLMWGLRASMPKRSMWRVSDGRSACCDLHGSRRI